LGGWQETVENQGFRICRNVCPSEEIFYPTQLNVEEENFLLWSL